MVAIGLTSLVIFALVSFLIIRNQIERSILKQAVTTIKVFTSSIHEDILGGLDTEVYRKCLSVLEDELVSEIVVTGIDERNLCQESKSEIETSFVLNREIFFSPVENVVAGRIKIGFQNHIIQVILDRILALLGFLLFLLGIIYWLLSRFVLGSETKKIQDLSNMLSRSDIEELEKCSSILSEFDSVELSRLCEGVEKLSANWRSYQAELVKNETLKAINKSSRLLAHDIKSPLGAIKTGLAYIYEKPESGKKLVDRGIERIESMVHDLLKRDEKFSLKIDSRPVLLKEFVESLREDILSHYAEFGGIRIAFDSLFHGKEVALFDHDEICRCVINLVKNSVEALNGVGEINVIFKLLDSRLAIEVIDTGPGISKDIIQDLEDEIVNSTKEYGNGLGLIQVKDAMVAHGGELVMTSSSKGTKIVLLIGAVI